MVVRSSDDMLFCSQLLVRQLQQQGPRRERFDFDCGSKRPVQRECNFREQRFDLMHTLLPDRHYIDTVFLSLALFLYMFAAAAVLQVHLALRVFVSPVRTHESCAGWW